MARKRFCDMCLKEIGGTGYSLEISNLTKYDLCGNCAEQVMKFISAHGHVKAAEPSNKRGENEA